MSETLKNNLLAVFKSVAAATPIGSAIVTAVNEYVPSAHDKALQMASEALHNRIVELDQRLEADFVKTDEFVDLFKNCYIIFQRTQYEEKLKAAANIITNALLSDEDGEKLKYDELDHFARCVESLPIGAIRLLVLIINHAGSWNRNISPPKVSIQNMRVDFGAIHGLVPDLDHDLVMGMVGELSTFNLLHSLGSPGVGTEKYSNYPIQTTPLGYRFTRYILDSWDSET